MQCKNHPERHAEHFCGSCGIPLCEDCVEETASGERCCFQCAMFQTVSGVGSSIKDRREKAAEKKLEDKKKWGPFQYFLVASSALVVVMWGVILFGGQKAPPSSTGFAENERAFLFTVDSAIKRFADDNRRQYPDQLPDLVPKYLKLTKQDLNLLQKLSYRKDSTGGYRLCLAHPKPNSMNVILSSKGLKYEMPTTDGGA